MFSSLLFYFCSSFISFSAIDVYNILRLDNDETAREINRLNLENVSLFQCIFSFAFLLKAFLEVFRSTMCLYFRGFFYLFCLF